MEAGRPDAAATGDLFQLAALDLNDAGQTLVSAFSSDEPDAGFQYVVAEAGKESRRVFGEGDTAPNGRTFGDQINQQVKLNEAGQVLFRASFEREGGGRFEGNNVGQGLFRSETDGSLTTIALVDGDPMLAAFDFLGDIALNDSGQAAFTARISGSASAGDPGESLLFYDGVMGTTTVAATGDDFLGSTLTDVSLQDLNNLGRVGYRFDLADGRSGLAVWTADDAGGPSDPGARCRSPRRRPSRADSRCSRPAYRVAAGPRRPERLPGADLLVGRVRWRAHCVALRPCGRSLRSFAERAREVTERQASRRKRLLLSEREETVRSIPPARNR